MHRSLHDIVTLNLSCIMNRLRGDFVLQPKTRWKEKEYNGERVSELASKLQLSPLVVSLFLGRGLDTEDKILDF